MNFKWILLTKLIPVHLSIVKVLRKKTSLKNMCCFSSTNLLYDTAFGKSRFMCSRIQKM